MKSYKEVYQMVNGLQKKAGGLNNDLNGSQMLSKLPKYQATSQTLYGYPHHPFMNQSQYGSVKDRFLMLKHDLKDVGTRGLRNIWRLFGRQSGSPEYPAQAPTKQ